MIYKGNGKLLGWKLRIFVIIQVNIYCPCSIALMLHCKREGRTFFLFLFSFCIHSITLNFIYVIFRFDQTAGGIGKDGGKSVRPIQRIVRTFIFFYKCLYSFFINNALSERTSSYAIYLLGSRLVCVQGDGPMLRSTNHISIYLYSLHLDKFNFNLNKIPSGSFAVLSKIIQTNDGALNAAF